MRYSIWIPDKNNELYYFEDYIPLWVDKEKLAHTTCEFVEKIGLCKRHDENFTCAYCNHPLVLRIDEDGIKKGTKHCISIFHDLIKPKEWTPGDIRRV